MRNRDAAATAGADDPPAPSSRLDGHCSPIPAHRDRIFNTASFTGTTRAPGRYRAARRPVRPTLGVDVTSITRTDNRKRFTNRPSGNTIKPAGTRTTATSSRSTAAFGCVRILRAGSPAPVSCERPKEAVVHPPPACSSSSAPRRRLARSRPCPVPSPA
ncbi:hypothetical protein EVAR_40392_1 [Eumeta japonica]|uniref:Uncharacterized protein n=1 Tax=Eumeta variegata TaxID=151549 RepID=A0A4C1W9A1_EUMVA|nr:hypothetical protein EVAR_40392_1 [Eumeta japonica]